MIEYDVCITGDVTILPGVKIVKDTVIGAKNIVTKDIPENDNLVDLNKYF